MSGQSEISMCLQRILIDFLRWDVCLNVLQYSKTGSLFFLRKQVSKSRSDAEKEGIHVPTTIEEYCIQTKPESQSSENFMDLTDDWYEDMDDYDDDNDEECFDNYDDSGNEDS